MKVLFCTDGSEESVNSLYNLNKYATDIEIDILFVIDWNFYSSYAEPFNEYYEFEYRKNAEGILNNIESLAGELGLKVNKKLIEYGLVSEKILEQLKMDYYGLVLLGSSGKRGIKNWLGSVSRQITSNASTPSFVSKGSQESKKILFAFQNIDNFFDLIMKSMPLFDLKNSELFVMHVIDVHFRFDFLNQEKLDYILRREYSIYNENIFKIENLLDRNDLKLEKAIVEEGNIAERIIEKAKEENIDLIITGHSLKKTFLSKMLGSVSKRILTNFPFNVVVIP